MLSGMFFYLYCYNQVLVTTMASQNENGDPPKESVLTPHTTKLEREHSKASQVLETIKNLIVEM